MSIYKGAAVLLIAPLWSSRIFDARDKVIEIRGEPTSKRGSVFVVESGSYFISGVMELWACEGPLSPERWEELRGQHCVSGERAYGADTYAWHVRNCRRVSGIPCGHTSEVKWIRWGRFVPIPLSKRGE